MIINILNFQLSFFWDKDAFELYTPLLDIVIPFITLYIAIGAYGIKLVWENR